MSNNLNNPTIQKETPANGGTVNIQKCFGPTIVVLSPATDLATLTVNFCSNPDIGQLVTVFSTKKIASLTLANGTMDKTVTSVTPWNSFQYIYDSADSIWLLNLDSTMTGDLPIAYVNGVRKTNEFTSIYDVTTTTGQAVVQLTTNGLSGGTALFSEVHAVIPVENESNFNDSFSWAFTNSNKTLTVTAKRLTFTGVTILGINALGANSMANVPNGTAIRLIVIGK